MKIRLIALICIVLLCLTACGNKEDDNSIQDTANETTNQTTYVDVFFYNNAGTVVKTDKIPQGADIISPPSNILADGFVFSGWDKSLNDIQETTHYYPIYTDIRELTNAVYAPAVYALENGTASVNIQIGGCVSFSCIEMQISFNDDVLSLNEITAVDGDGVCHYDKDNETVYFSMASAQNISAGVDLFTLNFSIISSNVTSADITIKINDIAEFDNKNELVTTTYNTINGRMFIN